MLKTILLIGAGSFAGGIARYLLTRAVQPRTGGAFPWGTLAVNVAGCFLIGLLYGLFERNFAPGSNTRLFFTVGVCGGFTTFSTFVHELYGQLAERNLLGFVLYATLSFGLGLLFAHVGHLLVRAGG